METHDYGLGTSVYGMVVQADTTTGEPLMVNGQYVNSGFDVSAGEPITGNEINTYGQVIGGIATVTLVPGFYPGGIILSNDNKVRLLPGIYAFGGGNSNGDKSGLVMTGGYLEGRGVMVYVTYSQAGSKQYAGRVELNGGEVILTESYDPDNPTTEPYPNFVGSEYKYIAIFQDRANLEPTKITGNTTFRELKGSLYFPTTHMVFSGVGIEGGTQLIAGSIETQGTTSLRINYDGRFFAAGYKAMLVK